MVALFLGNTLNFWQEEDILWDVECLNVPYCPASILQLRTKGREHPESFSVNMIKSDLNATRFLFLMNITLLSSIGDLAHWLPRSHNHCRTSLLSFTAPFSSSSTAGWGATCRGGQGCWGHAPLPSQPPFPRATLSSLQPHCSHCTAFSMRGKGSCRSQKSSVQSAIGAFTSDRREAYSLCPMGSKMSQLQ